jgi:hypothetical protein
MKTHLKKGLVSAVGQRSFGVGVMALALTAGSTKVARADSIPYPDSGLPNLASYSFTAASSGNITAYFAGGTAGFDTEIGMLVNGVSTGIIGLDVQSATVGQSLNLGAVNAGDSIVFELINNSIGQTAYSDPSLNLGYDPAGENQGHQHIFSTAYTRSSDIIDPKTGAPPLLLSDNVPVGTFIGWEDLPFTGGIGSEPLNVQTWEHTRGWDPTNADYDYDDLSIVVTDVSTNVPDSGSSLTLLGIGLAGIGLVRRRLAGK